MKLWVEAINTACYTINEVYVHPGMSKTSYKIWRDKKSNHSYFIFLVVNATFWMIENIFVNLIQKVKKVFFLIIPIIVEPIVFIT